MEQAENSYLNAAKSRYNVLYSDFNTFAGILDKGLKEGTMEIVGPFSIHSYSDMAFGIHHKTLTELRSEVMRQAIMSGDLSLIEFDSSEVFDSSSYLKTVGSWIKSIVLRGYESISLNNEIHLTSDKTLKFEDPMFISNLLRLVTKVSFFGKETEKLGAKGVQGFTQITDEEMKDAYCERGVGTFSMILAGVMNYIRPLDLSIDQKREILLDSARSHGLLGQLMRTSGATVTSDLLLDHERIEFKSDAPIALVQKEDGKYVLQLDILKASEMFDGFVNIDKPNTVKIAGKIPCPAYGRLNTHEIPDASESDSILFWILRQAVEQTPDSYFT